jgi:hypothetical protein
METARTNTVVIFYNKSAYQAGEGKCFGCRFNDQLLPQGSVVVGFIIAKPLDNWIDLNDVIFEPEMNSAQGIEWDATIVYARNYLKNSGQSMWEYDGL